MVYINSHIRRLEAYQKIKQRGLPINIIFNTYTHETYAGMPPGIYWPVLRSPLRDDECRRIHPWFTIIRGDRVKEIGIIKEPTEYKPINLHCGGGGDIPTIDDELEEYVKTKDRPRAKVVCII